MVFNRKLILNGKRKTSVCRPPGFTTMQHKSLTRHARHKDAHNRHNGREILLEAFDWKAPVFILEVNPWKDYVECLFICFFFCSRPLETCKTSGQCVGCAGIYRTMQFDTLHRSTILSSFFKQKKSDHFFSLSKLYLQYNYFFYFNLHTFYYINATISFKIWLKYCNRL